MGLRNIQLGLFALPMGAGAMLLNDWDQVREYGILQGFDNVVVWLVVLLIGAGGLLVAATMKYADNIVKCFATAIAIVLDIVLSIPIFHFIPSWSFIVGAPLVIVATTKPANETNKLLPGGGETSPRNTFREK